MNPLGSILCVNVDYGLDGLTDSLESIPMMLTLLGYLFKCCYFVNRFIDSLKVDLLFAMWLFCISNVCFFSVILEINIFFFRNFH